MAEQEQRDHHAALQLNKLLDNRISYSELTADELYAVLSQRVTYAEAADILCISRDKLRQLIRDGEIPVVQKSSGRRPALIEAGAIKDYMDRLRSHANREAAARRAAAQRGQPGTAA